MWKCFICGGEVGEEFNECTQCSEKKRQRFKNKSCKGKEKNIYGHYCTLRNIMVATYLGSKPFGFGSRNQIRALASMVRDLDYYRNNTQILLAEK